MAFTQETQPKSLRIFFGTEMWERYGFYVVQSLLALYLALHFQWRDDRIYALVGSFTALTYLSPIVGGYIADRMLGQKRAILSGLAALFLSYCFLTLFETGFAINCALAGIAVGTGLLKPNISSLLGNEYHDDSQKRESGFTIFYMGITSGIILGTTIPSQLNHYFGWSASFASAAFVIVLAVFIFGYGVWKYALKDYKPYQYKLNKIIRAIALLSSLWVLSFYVLANPQFANFVFGFVVLVSFAYLLFSIYSEPKKQALLTLVIGLLCLISVLFWSFYFQMFTSLILYILRVVEPSLWGISFPPPYYITVQSAGMLLIGYFLAKRPMHESLVKKGLSAGRKFLAAMVAVTIGYSIIVVVSKSSHSAALLSPLMIIPAYLMISLAELLLSPVGLSAVTYLACKNKVSTMMGIFFVSLGIGAFFSGKLATITSIPVGMTDVIALKQHYAQAFLQELVILTITTLICVLIFAIIRYILIKVEHLMA